MELYKELLSKLLEKNGVHIAFSNTAPDMEKIIELECYKALEKIKVILKDDGLTDETCFSKIEEIVCLFEDLGSDCGNRHDFG